MLRQSYITRLLSGFLLIIFALSITPKRFLHDAFAKHIDSGPVKDSHSSAQFDSAGYNCDNDNLVAESCFVSDQQSFSFPAFISFPFFIAKNISFSSAFRIYSPLRGPPCINI